MNILAIDTSTNVLGVGLANDDKVIGEYITNIKRNHSTRVLPAIDYLLKDCGMDIREIDKIVVAEGPGSYTGLRIGATIGKTLAWTLNIPLTGISTLRLMAASANYFSGLLSPIIDGKRGNVFTGLYKLSDGKLEDIIEDQHIPVAEWVKTLTKFQEHILFIGNDLSIHRNEIGAALGDLAKFASVTVNNPRPGELAFLGKNQSGTDIHMFVPKYLRLSEAEAKWREKNGE